MLTILIAVALSAASDAPAQPPAEESVGAEFEAASRELFMVWLEGRPERLRDIAKGRQDGRPGRFSFVQFQFLECSDESPPAISSIDVKKTDSVLSPFIGVIRIATDEQCFLRPVWPPGMGGKAQQEAMIPRCVGHSYQDCIEARGKPMPEKYTKIVPRSGETTVYYRWSHGRWEFDKEDPADGHANDHAPSSSAVR